MSFSDGFRRLRHLLLVATAVVPSILVLPGEAQTNAPSDPNVDNGTHWYGSYDGVHENVGLSSGNVSFCIPLVSLKGRNKHDLSVPLCYNSQFQQLSSSPQGAPPAIADVLSYFPWLWAPSTPSGDTTPPMGPGWVFSGAPAYYESPLTSLTGLPVEFMPDGATYTFPSTNTLGPDGQNADIYNTGESGLQLKDGTRFVTPVGYPGPCFPAGGCATETFTEGAMIGWTDDSIIDTVGRTVNVVTGSSFSGSYKTSSTAYIQVQYPDSSDVTRTVTVEMTTMQFTQQFRRICGSKRGWQRRGYRRRGLNRQHTGTLFHAYSDHLARRPDLYVSV